MGIVTERIKYTDVYNMYKLCVCLQQLCNLGPTLRRYNDINCIARYLLLTSNIIRLLIPWIVLEHVGRFSVVDMATYCGPDGSGSESRWGLDFPQLSRPSLGPTQPLMQWVLGLFLGVKAVGVWR